MELKILISREREETLYHNSESLYYLFNINNYLYFNLEKICDIFWPEIELQVRTKEARLIRRGVLTENKVDQVESILAETRCETAITQKKRSNIGEFPLRRKQRPGLLL